jgi:F-box domain
MLPIQEGTQQLAAFFPTNRCPFLSLPQDLIHYILLHLGAESTSDCSLLCKRTYAIIQDQENSIWQKLYFRDFERYYPKQKDGQSFQQAYQSCHSCEFNLKEGRFTWRTIAYVDVGQGRAATFSMPNGKLCIRQINGTITVQDLKTKEKFTLPSGQLGNCYTGSKVIYKNQLFVFKMHHTYGSCIDMYDLETKQHLGVLENSLLFYDFFLWDNKLIFNNANQEIWVWSIDTKTFSDPISLPLDGMIWRMAASKEKFFLATTKGEVFVFDIKTSRLNTFGRVNGKITCLAASENELIAANSNGRITILDIYKESILFYLKHQNHREIDSLVVANGKLFSASAGTIRIWDISTGKCLNTLQTHVSNLLCVVDKKIFSGSYIDGTIKVCDFSESHSAILANSAELLREGDHEARTAMAQFNALPADVKNSIYGEMYQLLKPFDNDYFGCGAHAFHDHHGLSSTRQQKAQAIENYLAKRK